MAWGCRPRVAWVGKGQTHPVPARGFVETCAWLRPQAPQGPEPIPLTKFSPMLYIQYVLKTQI